MHLLAFLRAEPDGTVAVGITDFAQEALGDIVFVEFPKVGARVRAGDAVLLSPACASLDMFRNYAHRAEVFVAEVQSQAAARGEVIA